MEPSTHNVSQLAERNATDYTSLDGEGQAEEKEESSSHHIEHSGSCYNNNPHPNVLAKALSQTTDAVHSRLSRLIRRIERSDSFKYTKKRTAPLFASHLKPHSDITYTNIHLASENLVAPIETSAKTLRRAAETLSASADKVQGAVSGTWRGLFAEGGALRGVQERLGPGGGGEKDGDYGALETQHGGAGAGVAGVGGVWSGVGWGVQPRKPLVQDEGGEGDGWKTAKG